MTANVADVAIASTGGSTIAILNVLVPLVPTESVIVTEYVVVDNT